MSIDKEVLIYANLPYKKFRWISYISAMQMGFLLLNLFVLPNSKQMEKRKRTNKLEDDIKTEQLDNEQYKTTVDVPPKGFFAKIMDVNFKEMFTLGTMVENIKDRPGMTALMTTCCALVTTGTFYYAKRSIHTIKLLPNERVSFQFFSPFAIGQPSSMVIPLRNVSCQAPRKSSHNYSILKLRGYKGYHLVHKAEGYFLEPKLYDKYLGYSRSWSS